MFNGLKDYVYWELYVNSVPSIKICIFHVIALSWMKNGFYEGKHIKDISTQQQIRIGKYSISSSLNLFSKT